MLRSVQPAQVFIDAKVVLGFGVEFCCKLNFVGIFREMSLHPKLMRGRQRLSCKIQERIAAGDGKPRGDAVLKLT